jgi:hypothetical protein
MELENDAEGGERWGGPLEDAHGPLDATPAELFVRTSTLTQFERLIFLLYAHNIDSISPGLHYRDHCANRASEPIITKAFRFSAHQRLSLISGKGKIEVLEANVCTMRTRIAKTHQSGRPQ